ncbi:MAG: sulfatase-like hydrolase/transferase [Myxococcota bacterium]
MGRGNRIRAAAVGSGLGAGFFVADFIGALLAIGFLFDPKWETYVLLVIAAIMAVVVGALAAVLLATVWWPRRVSSQLATWGLVAGGLTVVALGYVARSGRQHEPAPSPLVAQEPERTPPILWVVVDTLRADTLYGDALDFPLAPETGDFAKDSLVFADAESTAGWTIPSLAALFTGIHNTTTDASAGFLPGWAPSIASRLSAAGYSTHALVDNVIIEPRNGFAVGFDSFFQRSGYRFVFSLPSFRLLPTPVREAMRGVLRTSYYGSRKLTDRAIEVIEKSEPRSFTFVLTVIFRFWRSPDNGLSVIIKVMLVVIEIPRFVVAFTSTSVVLDDAGLADTRNTINSWLDSEKASQLGRVLDPW